MTIDVSELVRANRTSNRGQDCATCVWLRSRPDQEREAWNAEMAKPRQVNQHAAVHRAMGEAAKRTDSDPPPSISSVRKHRTEEHTA